MSTEPRPRPSLHVIFSRLATSLPQRDSYAGAPYTDVPSYRGIRILGQELGLAVKEVAMIGDPSEADGTVIMLVLDHVLVGHCVVNPLEGCVTLHAEPGECAAGQLLFSIDHVTATVTEADGVVETPKELLLWMLRSLEAKRKQMHNSR